MTTILQRTLQLMVLGVLAVGVAACGETHADNHGHDHDHAIADVDTLVAVMRPTEGNNVRGVVIFTSVNGEVRATARITGLAPNQKHAIHIHQWGDDRSNDGTSTGGHYNPEGHDHGLPDQEHRHAGDLGNLEADADGNASFEIVVDNITLAATHNPIIGRAVIIHESEDDGSQPVGAAGARIASGIIGVANPEID